MGFTLKIKNAPGEAAWWKWDFAENVFKYDPPAFIGAIPIDETSEYPSDPRGCTTLLVEIYNASRVRLLVVRNLGPVNDGVDYEFDASTRKLSAISVEPAPGVILPWIGSIFSFVGDIAGWFLSGYREVSGWIWPFYYLQYPLYGLWRVTWSLLTPIAHFWLWAEDIATKISRVFSLNEIVAYFRIWLDYATTAWNWVRDAFWNVWNIADAWWTSAKWTVLAWIDMATEGFFALRTLWDEFWKITFPLWTSKLEVLGSEVSHFFTETLPTLFDFKYAEEWWRGKLPDIGALIHSSLLEWFPFYDDVAEFFKDPGEFLLSRLTDWFLGKEK